MKKQELKGQELSNEEMKDINGGSGIFDGLPILGDLLGNSGGSDDEGSGNGNGSSGNGSNNNGNNNGSQNNGNSGGILGGIL